MTWNKLKMLIIEKMQIDTYTRREKIMPGGYLAACILLIFISLSYQQKSQSDQIYRCKSVEGEVTFSDIPCVNSGNTQTVKTYTGTSSPQADVKSNVEALERSVDAVRDLRAAQLGLTRKELDIREGRLPFPAEVGQGKNIVLEKNFSSPFKCGRLNIIKFRAFVDNTPDLNLVVTDDHAIATATARSLQCAELSYYIEGYGSRLGNKYSNELFGYVKAYFSDGEVGFISATPEFKGRMHLGESYIHGGVVCFGDHKNPVVGFGCLR